VHWKGTTRRGPRVSLGLVARPIALATGTRDRAENQLEGAGPDTPRASAALVTLSSATSARA